jgi:hypothetical protein
MERAMRRAIACIAICLLFITATAVNALVEIDRYCMDVCQDKGDTYVSCLNKCTAKPESNSVAPVGDGPKIHFECIRPCQDKGNTREFCINTCTY